MRHRTAAAPGGGGFSFALTPPTGTPAPGSLIVTVTTPGQIVTTAFYNLTD